MSVSRLALLIMEKRSFDFLLELFETSSYLYDVFVE